MGVPFTLTNLSWTARQLTARLWACDDGLAMDEKGDISPSATHERKGGPAREGQMRRIFLAKVNADCSCPIVSPSPHPLLILVTNNGRLPVDAQHGTRRRPTHPGGELRQVPEANLMGRAYARACSRVCERGPFILVLAWSPCMLVPLPLFVRITADAARAALGPFSPCLYSRGQILVWIGHARSPHS